MTGMFHTFFLVLTVMAQALAIHSMVAKLPLPPNGGNSVDTATLKELDEGTGNWKDFQDLKGWPKLTSNLYTPRIADHVVFDSRNGIFVVPVGEAFWDFRTGWKNHSTWFVFFKRGNPQSFATLGPIRNRPLDNLLGGESGAVFALFHARGTAPRGILKITTSPTPSLGPLIHLQGEDWSIAMGHATYHIPSSKVIVPAFQSGDVRYLFHIDPKTGSSTRGIDLTKTKINDWSWSVHSLSSSGNDLIALATFETYSFNLNDGTVIGSKRMCPRTSASEAFQSSDRVQGKGYWFGACGDDRNVIFFNNTDWLKPTGVTVKPCITDGQTYSVDTF